MTAARQRLYTRLILASVVAAAALSAGVFAGWVRFSTRRLLDFDAYYLAGQLVLSGDIGRAYHQAEFRVVQLSMSDGTSFLAWTYPPPFNLIVGVLALLPEWLAYLAFIVPTLVGFMLVLRRLAGADFLGVLIAVYVPVLLTVICGQNGLLTATLLGLGCIALLRGGRWAGVPFGLMVIKPHLALGFGLYVLARRDWRTAAVAVTVALGLCGVATLVLGARVWLDFFDAVGEAGAFLQAGLFPMYRMISPYASVRTLGLGADAAVLMQVLAAVGALAAVLLTARRLEPRRGLAVAGLATLLITPYAYDYDLPCLGIALALLAPDIRRFSGRIQAALAGLVALTSVSSLLQTGRLSVPGDTDAPRLQELATPAGIALSLLLALTWWALLRSGPERSDGGGRIVGKDAVDAGRGEGAILGGDVASRHEFGA